MDEVPDFNAVFSALQGKAAKWELIGIALKLSPDELDIIKVNSTAGVDQCRKCLLRVLQQWSNRENPRPTWRVVIEALKRSQVGEEALAKKLEDRFAPRDPPLGSMSLINF